MRSLLSAVTLLSLVISFIVFGESNIQAAAENQFETQTVSNSTTSVQKDYGKTSLIFEENKGQTDRAAKFISRGSGYTVYLMETEAVFQLKRKIETGEETKGEIKKTKSDILKMQFVGANTKPTISGDTETITKTNYYIGKKRFENLSNYRKVNYKNLYEGIDAVFYSNADKQLEYDFTVAPNVDTNQIGLNFEGAENISIDEAGNLIVKTENTELVQQKPFAYQTINGEMREIESKYVINEQSKITFALGEYDKSQTLIIDPALNYLTYIGGTAFDDVFEVAADNTGNAYITGKTASLNFHGQTRDENDVDGAYIAKINPQGSDFVYITILEGNGNDTARGIALDVNNNAFVTGVASHFFPTTSGAYDTIHGILNFADVFVAKLNTTGGLVYSTFLGGNGSDEGFDVAVDVNGKAYVTGSTFSNSAFPTKNRYQGCGDDSVVYATFLGGAGTDQGNGIAVNSSNQAVVVGLTGSSNFPLLNAFDSTNQINEGFVTVMSSTGATLANSSFLGGADQDNANNVALDSTGSIYVTGNTLSNDFPMALPFQSARVGLSDAFFAKIRIGTGVISSSYLGGNGDDVATGIAVRGKNVFIVGQTESNNLLTTAPLPFQPIKSTSNASASNTDGFVAKIIDTHLDSVGVFRPSTTFILTQSTTNIVAQNATFTSALAGQKGVSGDWNGDGTDTIGSFTNGAWKIRNSNFLFVNPPAPFGATTFNFGVAGDLPIVGDWDGDGIDTAGTFRPSTGQFFLTNTANAQAVNVTQQFGVAGDLPIAGDWNADGIDTIGIFRPSAGQFFLTNSQDVNPTIDFVAFFGNNTDLPLAGDFDGNGTDTIGVWRTTTAEFFLSNDNVSIARQFVFGAINTDQPIVGDWDGRPLP